MCTKIYATLLDQSTQRFKKGLDVLCFQAGFSFSDAFKQACSDSHQQGPQSCRPHTGAQAEGILDWQESDSTQGGGRAGA